MAEDPPDDNPISQPFSLKSETWVNGRLFTYEEYYNVIRYADHSRYIEIHKPGCMVWHKEGLEHGGEEPPYLLRGMVIGTLADAERSAERKVRNNKYPGWKRAPCCFDPNWKGIQPSNEEISKLLRLHRPKETMRTAFRHDKHQAGFK